MKVYIVDISGKTVNYDMALFKAIRDCESSSDVKLLISNAPKDLKDGDVIKLLSLIPARFYNTEFIIKRALKAFEGIINYIFLCFVCLFKRPDIVHFQWLPFLEVTSVERCFIRIMKWFSSKTRFVLTIHNVYPHNVNDKAKEKYCSRFKRVASCFNNFIVHTDITKKEVIDDFGLDDKKVSIVHHGIFIPKDYVSSLWKKKVGEKWNLIMYGNQSYYKGTDVLIEALKYLSEDIKSKIKLTICGDIQKSYYEQLKSVETGVELKWIPSFVESKKLYSMIDEADIILLPYREISQSGVLLLALYFKRPIIASNLPSFRETLSGFTDEMFCEAGDPISLANVISCFIKGNVDINKQLALINELNIKYSWQESAKMTFVTYMNKN